MKMIKNSFPRKRIFSNILKREKMKVKKERFAYFLSTLETNENCVWRRINCMYF